jgi:two-component system OmpR family response regulator
MRVLIVEDEPNLGRQLRSTLEGAGYAVDLATDGEDGHYLGSTESYDAVILDLGLPEIDGLTVLDRWRKESRKMPVLVLTARDSWSDKVAGLDAGADDYLVKPFALDELFARVRALLRRSSITDGDEVLTVGDLVLDPSRRQAWRAGRELELTKTEFDLLELLMFNAGIVVTRDSIYQRIWGYDFETSSKSLDVYIGYLRRKTEIDGAARLIHTIRGIGYTVRTS